MPATDVPRHQEALLYWMACQEIRGRQSDPASGYDTIHMIAINSGWSTLVRRCAHELAAPASTETARQ